MSDQNKPQPAEPNIASFEGDLFGALFGFHEKAMRVLRSSGLDDDKLDLVAERIKLLLDGITAEIKQSHGLDLAERLEAAYDEVERLVHELSGLHADGDGEEA